MCRLFERIPRGRREVGLLIKSCSRRRVQCKDKVAVEVQPEEAAGTYAAEGSDEAEIEVSSNSHKTKQKKRSGLSGCGMRVEEDRR